METSSFVAGEYDTSFLDDFAIAVKENRERKGAAAITAVPFFHHRGQ